VNRRTQAAGCVTSIALLAFAAWLAKQTFHSVTGVPETTRRSP
jgi:hypothetical protein